MEEPIYERYVEAFVAETEKLRLGGPFEVPPPDVGPMVNEAGLRRMGEFVWDARKKGGQILCGGKRSDDPRLARGFYFEPTVVVDVKEDMRLMKEEPFGPIVGIDAFRTVEEAIVKANNVPYGLVAYVYTKDFKKAWYVAENLEWGTVAINNVNPNSLYAPYGDWKESGLGVKLGRYGLEEYLEWKHIKIEVG